MGFAQSHLGDPGGNMQRTTKGICIALLLCLPAAGQTKKQIDQALTPEALQKYRAQREQLYSWNSAKFLLGEWRIQANAAEASTFNAKTDLDNKVLLISNAPRLPGLALGAVQRAAKDYKSLTIIYVEGLSLRASFYDNEGHSQSYDVVLADNPKRLVLVDPIARKNVVYEQLANDQVAISLAPGAMKSLGVQKKTIAVRVTK